MTRAIDNGRPNRAAADIIGECRDRILQAWSRIVYQRMEDAEQIDEPALVDDVPGIVELVEQAFREGTAHADQDFKPVRVHGDQRAGLSQADIEWLRREIRYLRSVIIDFIEADLGPLGHADLMLIYRIFEQITAVSTNTYIDVQTRRAEAAHAEAQDHVARLGEVTETLQQEREQRELFVKAIVHDLRTPLSAVQMAADLLAKVAGRPDARKAAIDRLHRNISRIDRLAQRLLDISLIAAGRRLPLNIESGDLAEIVAKFLADARSTFADADIHAELPDHTELAGHWNAGAIERILHNLVENALKYGRTPVTVGLNAGDDGPRVWVHDQGGPIPADKQDDIFERFVRLDHPGNGWGLGLTLVRGLAHALGGQLNLDSQPGQGTTFELELPWDSRPWQTPDDAGDAQPAGR